MIKNKHVYACHLGMSEDESVPAAHLPNLFEDDIIFSLQKL